MLAADDKDRQRYLIGRKCWRKKGFSTATRAHKEAKKIFKKTGVRLYIYWCDGCSEVHLTKNILGKGRVL